MNIYLFFFSITALIGLAACKPNTAKRELPKPHIIVVEAVEKKLPTRMQFVGETASLYDVVIQPRVSGYLLSTHYNSGLPVKKGQLLFKLDSNPMQVELSKALAEVATAKSKLVEAQNDYNRSVPLARINAISKSALDQATANLASAKASLNSANASLRNANLDLSYATIHAPTDGVIGETVGSIGDFVGVGTKYPVLNTISNVDSIYVDISIPTSIYLSITGRDSLNLPIYANRNLLTDIDMILEDGSLYPKKGEYKYTERVVNNQSGAVVVKVAFGNKERFLKAGQYVRIEANVGKDIGVVLVPQRSVMQTQGVNVIYVVDKDSTVQYRSVELGNTHAEQWGVLSGIEAGDMVLAEGLLKVKSGMKIVPISASAQKPNPTESQPKK